MQSTQRADLLRLAFTFEFPFAQLDAFRRVFWDGISSADELADRFATVAQELEFRTGDGEQHAFCNALRTALFSTEKEAIKLSELLETALRLRNYSPERAKELVSKYLHRREEGGSPADYVVEAFKERKVDPALCLLEKAFWDSPGTFQDMAIQIRAAAEVLRACGFHTEYEFCDALHSKLQDVSKKNGEVKRVWFLKYALAITNWVEEDPFEYACDYVDRENEAELRDRIVQALSRAVRTHAANHTAFRTGLWESFTTGISLLWD